MSEYSDLNKFLNFINANKDALAIYGTGEAGRVIWDCITNFFNIPILFFIDRDDKKTCCGLPVLNICNVPQKVNIIIAASPEYNIEQRLINSGISNYMYIDPVFLNFYCHKKNYIDNNIALINNNKDKIVCLKSVFQDDLSIKIFDEMLKQRITPNLSNIIKYYDKGQYFGNDVLPNVSGVIVDCGAYTGDTFLRFINQNQAKDWYYYAFEADNDNCHSIEEQAISLGLRDKIDIFKLAVWDKKTTLSFDNSTGTREKTSGKVILQTNSESIDANSLDNIFLKEGITPSTINLITMDIEGAEPNALYGSREIIKLFHPTLAISIYHETEHLWEIPLQILELDNNYKLYIRHHRWNIADTVCYAIYNLQ